MRSCALVLLTLLGCVSRTNVGAEPVPTGDDAGVGALPDAAADAMLDAEQEAIRMFERELVGTWEGDLTLAETLTQRSTFVFAANSVYTFCAENLPCSAPGLFFVTDHISNGHFAGELQNGAMQRTELEDMWIDKSNPRILRFWLYNEASGLSFKAVLTRLD